MEKRGDSGRRKEGSSNVQKKNQLMCYEVRPNWRQRQVQEVDMDTREGTTCDDNNDLADEGDSRSTLLEQEKDTMPPPISTHLKDLTRDTHNIMSIEGDGKTTSDHHHNSIQYTIIETMEQTQDLGHTPTDQNDYTSQCTTLGRKFEELVHHTLEKLGEYIQSKWDIAEDFLQSNPLLGLMHQYSIDKELELLVAQMKLDAEILLHAYGIDSAIVGITKTSTSLDSPLPQPRPKYTTVGASLSQSTFKQMTFEQMQAQIAHKENHTFIVYMQKHPESHFLHKWASSNLHPSYSSTTMLGGGYFEIQFTNESGKTLTLSRQYKFNNHDMFTKWCIDFNLKTTYDSNLTNLSIWVQLWGLRHIFRTSQLFIKALHKNTIGEIIVIDPFKSYCSKIVKP
ncbi:uncharacterized protein [Physcomitrium patens]|uniref:Uncharacterized protein n=1 Tax=Physcomitrium patens TaxID=3218 RepID=A0A7I4DGP5_PHYPA|nr:uncharacterized protein LOC112279361 [Physcomitrium patens]|eukprot:XP_024369502.1 uncharacterized protein LOC112279361 [Physcomitrella patens]